MRRTLYIGLGGTGIKVIDGVKKQIVSTYGNVPPVIKFLGIDADMASLSESTLDAQERLFISVNGAYDYFLAHRDQYDDLPARNAQCLHSIHGSGAGQIRSNAYFLYQYNRRDIESIFRRMYCDLCRPYDTTTINMYEFSASTQIDVHLCLSLCGGFGSGIFLEISKLIKEIIPNSNIIVYAFSHEFFMHVGVPWNLKPNCYASLLEADYLINVAPAENIVPPFDSFYYINNQIDYNIIDFDSAKKSLVQILSHAPYGVVSHGDGAINDEIRHAMISGMFNVNLKSNKKAWVSSFGVSGLCYPKSEYEIDQKAFITRAVLDQLIYHNNNRLIDDFLNNTQSMFLFVRGNEDVLNRIIPSNEIAQGGNKSLLVFNPQNAVVDDISYKQQWPCYNIGLNTVVGPLVESFSRFLKDSINDLLFPLNGENCGLNVIHSALSQLRDLAKTSINEILTFIDISEGDSQQLQLTKEQSQEDYLAHSRHPLNRIFHRSLLQELESEINWAHEGLLKKEVEIKRLCYAKEYHSQLLDIIEHTIWTVENTRNHLQNILEEANAVLNTTPNSDLFINVRHSGFGLLQRQCEQLLLSVRESLHNTMAINVDGELFNTDVLMSHIQEYQWPYCSIETIIAEMPDEELDNHLRKVIQRSAPMMAICSQGHIDNSSVFDCLIIPKQTNLDVRLINSLHRVGYKGTPQIIQVDNADQILLFRQYGVIPPYFIEGVPEVERDCYSCESEFKKVIESGQYSPFSRQSYEDAVLKNGFSLQSSKTSQYYCGYSRFTDGINSKFGRIAIARDFAIILMDNEWELELVGSNPDFRNLCRNQKYRFIKLAAGFDGYMALDDQGYVHPGPRAREFERTKEISELHNVTDICSCEGHTVALHSDGTVTCIDEPGSYEGPESFSTFVSEWDSITQVTCGFDFVAGLKNNGTLVSVGRHFNCPNWQGIVSFDAFNCYYGQIYVIALLNTGEVVSNYTDEVINWRNVIRVRVGNNGYAIGLKTDGTAYAIGNEDFIKSVQSWRNIVDIECKFDKAVAILSNGEIVSVGFCHS